MSPDLLNQTCSISKPHYATSATTGAKVVTYEDNFQTSVPCAVQAGGSYEARVAARETGRIAYTVYLPYVFAGVPVTEYVETGYVIIPESGAAANRRLHVVGPPIDEAGREEFIKVPCEYQQEGGLL